MISRIALLLACLVSSASAFAPALGKITSSEPLRVERQIGDRMLLPLSFVPLSLIRDYEQTSVVAPSVPLPRL